MSIELSCPHCHETLRFKDEAAGKRIQCPHCRHAVKVEGGRYIAPGAASEQEERPERIVERPRTMVSSDGFTRVILVGVDIPLADMIVVAFKWSVAAFLVAFVWGLCGMALYTFVRWSTAS